MFPEAPVADVCLFGHHRQGVQENTPPDLACITESIAERSGSGHYDEGASGNS